MWILVVAAVAEQVEAFVGIWVGVMVVEAFLGVMAVGVEAVKEKKK